MKSKIVIIGLVIVIIILIGAIISVIIYDNEDNSDNILTVGKLEMNLTGFETEQVNNITIPNVGYAVIYDVQNNDTNFKLIISEVKNTTSLDEQKLVEYTGYNGTTICVVIDEYVYWIQICNADTEYQTQNFLNSLVLNGVIKEPNNNNHMNTETSTGTTSESSDNYDEEGIELPYDDTPGSPRRYYGDEIRSFYYTDANGEHYYSYEDRRVYDL